MRIQILILGFKGLSSSGRKASLRTADAFPDDRKCVCCSQANGRPYRVKKYVVSKISGDPCGRSLKDTKERYYSTELSIRLHT